MIADASCMSGRQRRTLHGVGVRPSNITSLFTVAQSAATNLPQLTPNNPSINFQPVDRVGQYHHLSAETASNRAKPINHVPMFSTPNRLEQ